MRLVYVLVIRQLDLVPLAVVLVAVEGEGVVDALDGLVDDEGDPCYWQKPYKCIGFPEGTLRKPYKFIGLR